jgi:ACR3 family arsenite transporter
MTTTTEIPETTRKKLGFLDRFLTLWIFGAMGIGISIGYFIPSADEFINSFSNGTTNVPLAIGLILMMYPPLTKVQFSKIPMVFAKPKLLAVSFFITWIIGPFLMFSLAVLFLKDYPDYMTVYCNGHCLERIGEWKSRISCRFSWNK